MRPFLQNQPEIAKLSQVLRDALVALVSAIKAGWNQQHHGDGTHGTVTADSLTAPVVRSQGRLIGALICDVNNPAASTTQPLVAPAAFAAVSGQSYNVLRVRTDSGASPTIIHGLSVVGREEGERVLIMNSGNGNLTLLLRGGSSSPVGTRFNLDANVATAVFNELTIGTGGIVEAVYMHHTFYNEKYWHLGAVREV